MSSCGNDADANSKRRESEATLVVKASNLLLVMPARKAAGATGAGAGLTTAGVGAVTAVTDAAVGRVVANAGAEVVAAAAEDSSTGCSDAAAMDVLLRFLG